MMIVWLSSLFLSGWVLKVLEREKIPFFHFAERRWGPNPRPHCSKSHVLSSTPLWGSRLKMLRNKCYSSSRLLNRFSTIFSPIKPDTFPRLCQEPRWSSHVSIQCDFSVLEWLSMIVLLSSLFLSGRVLQVLENEKILFFFFLRERRRGSNPRPHCSDCEKVD